MVDSRIWRFARGRGSWTVEETEVCPPPPGIVDRGLARRGPPHAHRDRQRATKNGPLLFAVIQSGVCKRKRGGKKMTVVDDLVRKSSA